MGVLDTFSLEGKIALLTGAAGIAGQQILRSLVEAGATTYIASRNKSALDILAKSYTDRGDSVIALEYDQSDEKSIHRMRDEILERSGTPHVLVNNAVARPMKQGYHDDLSAFDESMRINATGLFAITRAIGDTMAKQGRGSIINIGSIQGMVAPDPSVYRGTDMHGWYPDYFFHKGGMINFTRFTASYYGAQNVRCNCLSPGGIQQDTQPAAFIEQYNDRTFLGRLANEDDLMGAVVFLASDASSPSTPLAQS
ncbi:MAG TPA: SDR family oxidoreductase [Candidatus Hydrogenedentes bacterium]|nr:SDR family oxidoreductase [Candidatus Hydrogenedentota bacterium]